MMYCKFALLVCLFGAAVVVAYDFKDADYNEYIMQDLIEISEDSDEAFRFKRDTATAAAAVTTSSSSTSDSSEEKDDDKKCKSNKKQHHHQHGLYKCCNDASTEALHEKYKDMKKECMTEIRGVKNDEESSFDMFSCDKVNKTKDEYVCISECVGKKSNILDSAGKLIDAAAILHVKNELSVSQWQKDVAESVANKCLAEAKEVATTKSETVDTTEKKCSSAGLKFGHCIWREFTKSCPKEMQSDSKKCASLREKLEKGENIDYHSYHHHGKFHHGRGSESSEERK